MINWAVVSASVKVALIGLMLAGLCYLFVAVRIDICSGIILLVIVSFLLILLKWTLYGLGDAIVDAFRQNSDDDPPRG